MFVIALVVAVFLVYQPAWHGQFIWDDTEHVTHPELRSWHGLYWIWFDLKATPQYYPLLHSAFWFEHKLWGDAVLGYHLINIVWHATAALLVALILRRLKIPGAYLAAAIFALHPIEVESVAWITEQKNTLSAVFCLGAMLAYLRFDEARKTPFYLVALGLFVLGLLSKTVTATLPGALLVIFWWRRGRLSWRRDVLPLVPFFVLGAAAGLLTAWVERKLIGAEGASFDLTLIERCLIAGRVIWFYLGKLLWPANLIFIYPRWQISQAVWWQYLFPLAALLLLIALWTLRRRWRGPLAGLLFFAGTLFPVLGFCNVYPFLFSYVADHFQYLAGLGIIAPVAAGAALLLSRWRLWNRTEGYAACFVLLGILGSLTWRQSQMYADIETLYRTTIDRNPACWMAYNNLANVLIDRGQFNDAIVHLRTSLKIKPDNANAHLSLGNALARRGQLDEAIAQYRTALKVNPEYAEAHNNLAIALNDRGELDDAIAHFQTAFRIKPDFAVAYNNLGKVLAARGRGDEAIPQYRTALKINPEYAEAHSNLATALTDRGELDDAIAHFQTALSITPDFAIARNNLGAAFVARGQFDEAIAQYRTALKINPDYANAHFSLGNALAGRGQFDEAITHYKRALELRPDDVETYNKLGIILAGQGKSDEAMGYFRKALEIQPDFAEARNNLGLALAGRGRSEEALRQYQQILKVRPDNQEALNNLAWLRATCPEASFRNGAEALKSAQRVMQLTGGRNANVLDTLAAALAEAGRFSEAVETAERALALATGQNNSVLAETLQTRIKLYQTGVPYRDAQPSVSKSLRP